MSLPLKIAIHWNQGSLRNMVPSSDKALVCQWEGARYGNWSPGKLGYEGFSEVTGGRALYFRGLSVGETAGPACGTMRRGQDSPTDKSLKRPAREPWN